MQPGTPSAMARSIARSRRLGYCLLAALVVGTPAQAAESSLDSRNDHAVQLLRRAHLAESPALARTLLAEALAELDAVLADAPTPGQRRRAEFDRVVALSALGQHSQALQAYRETTGRHQTVASYVHSAAADSAAALGQPEQALTLYAKALAGDPENDAAHAGRIFALADLGRLDEAERSIRARLATHDSTDERLRLALIRAWSGWIDNAANAVDALAASQDSAELARQQGALALLRDRPYAALAAYERSLKQAPGYFGSAIDRTAALDRLGRLQESGQTLQALQALANDWPPLARAIDRRDAEHGAMLQSRLRVGRGGDRQIASGEVRHESTLWSPLFGPGLRAYASYRRAYADFRGTRLEDERRVAGLRWQINALRLQLEADDARDALVSEDGYAISADWRASDDWSFSAAFAGNAFDLPLRARGAGTTGDRWSAATRYSPRGQFSTRLSIGGIDYSDGNRRDELGLSTEWRLPLRHDLALSLSPGIYAGRDRLETVPYFSPLRDGSIELLAALDHRLLARLTMRHEQRLELFAGSYAQQGFAAAAIGGVRYQYALTTSPGRRWLARIGRDRRSYDGRVEYQSFAELALEYRL